MKNIEILILLSLLLSPIIASSQDIEGIPLGSVVSEELVKETFGKHYSREDNVYFSNMKETVLIFGRDSLFFDGRNRLVRARLSSRRFSIDKNSIPGGYHIGDRFCEEKFKRCGTVTKSVFYKNTIFIKDEEEFCTLEWIQLKNNRILSILLNFPYGDDVEGVGADFGEVSFPVRWTARLDYETLQQGEKRQTVSFVAKETTTTSLLLTGLEGTSSPDVELWSKLTATSQWQKVSSLYSKTSHDFVKGASYQLRVTKGSLTKGCCVYSIGIGPLVDVYFDPDGGQVNTALAPRPAGSTLKPFLTAQALDAGLVTPEERLADLPQSYQGYSPSNFDNSYRGLVTARDALVLSLNIPFVQLLRRLGVSRFGTTLRSLGLAHMTAPDESFGLGMAIGNVETTLVELVGAYGTLARGGVYLEPRAFARSQPASGGEQGPRLFSEGACWLVSDILSGDERSAAALGHIADVKAPKFAWKTGTSAAYRDAWTVAWNPEYVVGVWCGHKSGGFGDTTLVGAKAAAPIAWKIARGLYPQNTGPWFIEPEGIQRRTICSVSGLPANPDCPQTEEGLALAGRSATKLCSIHRRDAEGRLVTCNDAYLAAFAGKLAKAEKLSISKPENDATFCLVPGLPQQQIVCQVVGNVADGHLWWFVDGSPAGETVGLAPFAWLPSEGTHDISCSTAEGVTSSVRIYVTTK